MIKTVLQTTRRMGIKWVAMRGLYEISLRSGLHSFRFRPRPWESYHGLCDGTAVKFTKIRERAASGEWVLSAADLGCVMSEEERRQLIAKADLILSGSLPYFTDHWHNHGGLPRWEWNAFDDIEWRGKYSHWSKVSAWRDDLGDLKYVWEIGRFSYLFTLVRAYSLTGNDQYAEYFWRLLEDFVLRNPPNSTVHWKCGQETAMRAVAWIFALHTFIDSPATTPERLANLRLWLAFHAERIAADTLYAHLQQNNHSMSEGLGLLAIGMLLPDLKKADRWRAKGLHILESEGLALIRPDGTFRQKAHNYHRLMLQLYCVATSLLKAEGQTFSPELRERLGLAADYIYNATDLESGRCPNFGANDGALFLPLNCCDYTDFRPVVQTAQLLFRGRSVFQPGPWDEDILWLRGGGERNSSAVDRLAKDRKATCSFNRGGIYIQRSEQSWTFIHAENFEDRPGQADALHVDLWWKGLNIACDAGTYQYYGAPPWQNGLATTLVHNTVAVDGLDQMVKGSRFMWGSWLQAGASDGVSDVSKGIHYREYWHDGYDRPGIGVVHYRGILSLPDDCWIILDRLVGVGDHEYSLQWQLADFPHKQSQSSCTLELDTPHGSYSVAVAADTGDHKLLLERGEDQDSVRGWISRNYATKDPALSMRLEGSFTGSVDMCSVFYPGKVHLLERLKTGWRIVAGDRKIEIGLSPVNKGRFPQIIADQGSGNLVAVGIDQEP